MPQQLKKELINAGARIASHGFTVGFDFVQGVPCDIVSTFTPSWLAEYQENSYVLSDPVVIWGTENTGVRSWNALKKLYPNLMPDIIGIARSRGMKHGTVISITVNRKKTIMGITHDAPDLTAENRFELIGLMANITLELDTPSAMQLPDKHTNYLQQVAQGMSDHEIAEAMGVTPRSVYALRSRVIAKLGAKTIAQAVLTAYRLRLID